MFRTKTTKLKQGNQSVKMYTHTMIVYFVASTYTNKYAACRLLVYSDQDNGYTDEILNWILH